MQQYISKTRQKATLNRSIFSSKYFKVTPNPTISFGKRIRLCHIIVGLNQGGAETVLYRLVSQLDPAKYAISVISLQKRGYYSKQFEALNLQVYHLNMNYFNFLFKGFILVRLLKRLQPNLVQTWMYHANFLGGICAKLIGVPAIIWGLRNSGERLVLDRAILNWLSAKCSKVLPDLIITPSLVAAKNHILQGYQECKMKVIPNGVSTLNSPSKAYKTLTTQITIGMLARYHPQKDYPNFLRAIQIIEQNLPGKCYFLLAGAGVEQAIELVSLSNSLKLRNVTFLPAFADSSLFYNQLDIFVLSSAFGEAFPNVVAEAMSYGLPCVVTKVGDAADIVGDTGKIVAPCQPDQLAQACLELLNLSYEDRKVLGERAKHRICSEYSLENMIHAYESIYNTMLLSD